MRKGLVFFLFLLFLVNSALATEQYNYSSYSNIYIPENTTNKKEKFINGSKKVIHALAIGAQTYGNASAQYYNSTYANNSMTRCNNVGKTIYCNTYRY